MVLARLEVSLALSGVYFRIHKVEELGLPELEEVEEDLGLLGLKELEGKVDLVWLKEVKEEVRSQGLNEIEVAWVKDAEVLTCLDIQNLEQEQDGWLRQVH